MHAPNPPSPVTHRRSRYAAVGMAAGVIVSLGLTVAVEAAPTPPQEPPVETEPSIMTEPPPVTEGPATTITPAPTEPPTTTVAAPTEAPATTIPPPVEPPTTTVPAPTEARSTTIPTLVEPTTKTVPEPVVDPTGEQFVDENGDTVLGSRRAALRAAAVGNEHIVQVADEHVLTEVVADLTASGVEITNTIDGDFVGFTASLDVAVANELGDRAGVVRVERDEQLRSSGIQRTPPWNLDRLDQRRRPLDGRYSYRSTGAGVTAYVIDSGIRRSHVDFEGRIPRGAYFDFGDGTGIRDCAGHGTHVAGTIGGTRWGVAKLVDIVPVKALDCSGWSTTSIVLEAINWVVADHRVGVPAVVNMSFGGPASTILDQAVNSLIRDGITVVVAAGNESAPSCYDSPARVPAAITVAASTSRDDDAWFTNHGACNDVFAPGVDIRSASHASNTGSVVMSGTSMAAPHVSGAVALFLQGHRSATPAQVWAAIDADTTKGVLSECCRDPDKLLHVKPVVTAPSRPRSLAARPGNRSVVLSWAAPLSTGGAPIVDYRVQLSTNGGRSWTTVADGVSTARRTTVGRLTNGRRYYFRVAAKNRVGVGPWSSTVSAIPKAG